MLVSRNVFHVVSALQSIVFIHFFGRSYVGSVYRVRSVEVSHSPIKLAFFKKTEREGGGGGGERK